MLQTEVLALAVDLMLRVVLEEAKIYRAANQSPHFLCLRRLGTFIVIVELLILGEQHVQEIVSRIASDQTECTYFGCLDQLMRDQVLNDILLAECWQLVHTNEHAGFGGFHV